MKYIPENIDKKSDELIKEFFRHFSEVKRVEPNVSQKEAFEGWAIQKIAGIHEMLEQLLEWEQRARH